MGACGQNHNKNTKIETTEKNKEKEDLSKKKQRLKSNIDALTKQFKFMKNISIVNNENQQKVNINNMPINNINNINNNIFNRKKCFLKLTQDNNIENNNLENIFKFQVTGGGSLDVPVNERTTIGEVLTNLHNRLSISMDKQIYLLYEGQTFNHETSDKTLFKNFPFNPNNPIVIFQS